MRVDAGHAAVVPFGHLYIATCVGAGKSEAGSGHMLCYNVMSAKLAKQLKVSTRSAIHTVNESCFATKTEEIYVTLRRRLTAFWTKVNEE